MFFLIEIANLAAVKAFLVGIPEAMELFVFGVALIVAVVLLRWFLNRGNIKTADEKFSEKELTN
ncbi:MAG: hypothetical protein IPL32_11815 [Chloracidobacterium sp.]|nr:hypothetical protein [Chloracidobacterium sp.]